jgi:DNA-binding transcriptional ArsR family regulator
MADQDFVLAPATELVTVSVALEPVHNIVNSLMLLSHPEERSGFSSWVNQVAASLPPEVAREHRQIFKALSSAIEPEENWPSFPVYLDFLASEDPVVLRDRAIQWMCEDELGGLEPLDPETVLADRETYLSFIEQIHLKKMAEKDVSFEPEYYIEAHRLFNNPIEMQSRIVNHLRFMWDHYMAEEWERTLPMLQESVDAFQQLDYSHMTALEAVRVVTGRDFRGIWDEWGKELIFVPSPHIGPYVTRFDAEKNVMSRVVFGARLPEGARVSSPALSRSELLVRLSALGDDTRLQILELLTGNDELCATDIIKMLKLSQSAASRHLRQLTATGYLVERRREVAKCYSLNPQRVDDTLRALKRFLRAK